MKLTDQVGLYPHATITGRNGTVVDTGTDVQWPLGPARVYLHPREVAEAVRVTHQLSEVADVLEAEGWITATEHREVVDELTVAKDAAEAEVAGLRNKLAAVLGTISLVAPNTAPTSAVKPADAEPHPEPGLAVEAPAKPEPRKKKEEAGK